MKNINFYSFFFFIFFAGLQVQAADDTQATALTIERTSITPIAYIPSTPDECTNKDLRNPSLGEVHDQGMVGWCYAITAADLLSYKLNRKISYVDMALAHIQKDLAQGANSINFSDAAMMGGDPIDALQAVNVLGGACLEVDAPSEKYIYTNKTLVKKRGISVLVAEDNFTFLTEAEKLPNDYITGNSHEACEHFDGLNAVFPNIDLAEAMALIKQAPNGNAYLKKLSAENCAGKRIPLNGLSMKEYSTNNFDEKDTAGFLKIINDNLSQNNIVGISYNSIILDHESGNVAHASTIVGRRFYDGSCEYLIRNSGGKSCARYKVDDQHCEAGNIWVSEGVLKPMLFGVEYLK